MFEKISRKITNIQRDVQQKREERVLIEQERIANAARLERERIQKERDALMVLSEKELIVEAIMILRGYNIRITNLEEKQNEILFKMWSLESKLDSLDSRVSGMISY